MSVFLTEQLRVMPMLHFIPALVYVEKICNEELFSTRNMLVRFGVYLNELLNSDDYAKAFADFYDWSRSIGRTFKDWEGLSPMWLDQPDLAREIRTRQEWNGKPWPREVYADAGKMTMTDYLNWEENRRKFYLNEAWKFFGGGK